MSKINQYIDIMTFMIKIAQFITNNKFKSEILQYGLIQIGQKIQVYEFQNILKILKGII